MPNHTMDDVVELLQDVKQRRKGCCLLIGAGCSVSAGVPLARGFVDLIHSEYPSAYQRAACKIYPECMDKLTIDQRRDLIARFVNQAKINWAHIGMALLMKHGYVTRILTTNFDPLVIRACALLGEFPAVYDAAASQLFNAAFIPEKAVFYLHGQHTGFVLMHTEEECQRQTKSLAPLFEEIGTARAWLVAGYSGENDPVFERLAKYDNFDNRLYWLGYKDNEPSAHVRDELLLAGKDAHYLRGYDADQFFVELTRRLGLFPPELVSKPFTHLDALMGSLAPYQYGQESGLEDAAATCTVNDQPDTHEIIRTARKMIQQAIKDLEENSVPLNLSKLLMQEEYDQLIEYFHTNREMRDDELDAVSWAYTLQGNLLAKQAKSKTGEEADCLFQSACDKYEKALEIKSDKHTAWNNWGNTLAVQASSKTGEEADGLFQSAYNKYEKAVEIKPDKYEAWNNWGKSLANQAKDKTGEEADDLFQSAYDKFEKAVKVNPDRYEAWLNWGNSLAKEVKGKTGEEANTVYQSAYDKFEKAVKVNPDRYEAWNNWGNALANQAKSKTGEKAEAVYQSACNKYEKAVELEPDKYEAWSNWGNVLISQVISKTGEEADAVYQSAYDKFEKAVKIKPDKYETWNNWGNALANQAKSKTGEEAEALYQAACDKLVHVDSLRPGVSAYNLACIYALTGKEKKCKEWLDVCVKQDTIPDSDHIANDTDLDGVRERDWFKQYLPVKEAANCAAD